MLTKRILKDTLLALAMLQDKHIVHSGNSRLASCNLLARYRFIADNEATSVLVFIFAAGRQNFIDGTQVESTIFEQQISYLTDKNGFSGLLRYLRNSSWCLLLVTH
jgi:hypothetical protein